jgi:mRNA interferase HicA
VKYREVAGKLASLGCREVPRTGGGSHRKWLNPATNRSTTVPDWGGKDLKLGTIRAGRSTIGSGLGSLYPRLTLPRPARLVFDPLDLAYDVTLDFTRKRE